ncbi:Serine acetyltransferase [Melia azedarach]|uniref:Serine acetyltransferase n=2 Tax=Melia azedarach TaxID=155640 RepID=A0ACC1YKL0_MELAZ|nr:Serine acetyltransferase [Melia azedarach]KAJ4723976.1 Serine acetyltransferase [Melia azedarach]
MESFCISPRSRIANPILPLRPPLPGLPRRRFAAVRAYASFRPSSSSLASDELTDYPKNEGDGDDLWPIIKEEARSVIEGKSLSLFDFDDVYPLLVAGSLESALANHLAKKLSKSGSLPKDGLSKLFSSIFVEDSDIRKAILDDLRSAKELDFDWKSHLDCFLHSRGFLACQAYRAANKLFTRIRDRDTIMGQSIRIRASEVFAVDLVLDFPEKTRRRELVDRRTGVVIAERTEKRGNGGETSGHVGDDVHVIQMDQEDNNSASSIELSSSPSSGRARASAPHGNGEPPDIEQGVVSPRAYSNGDGQQPPDIEGERALPRANGDGDGQHPPNTENRGSRDGQPAPAPINWSSLAKVFLVFNGAVGLTSTQVWSNAGTSLSPNAMILLACASLLGLAGFVFSLLGYLLQHKRGAPELLTGIGCVAAICGFLSIIGTQLPEHLMLSLTFPLYSIPIFSLVLILVVKPFSLCR